MTVTPNSSGTGNAPRIHGLPAAMLAYADAGTVQRRRSEPVSDAQGRDETEESSGVGNPVTEMITQLGPDVKGNGKREGKGVFNTELSADAKKEACVLAAAIAHDTEGSSWTGINRPLSLVCPVRMGQFPIVDGGGLEATLAYKVKTEVRLKEDIGSQIVLITEFHAISQTGSDSPGLGGSD